MRTAAISLSVLMVAVAIPGFARAGEAPVTNGTVYFLNDVMPLVGKLGCNATACHGSVTGKGGFKLSMFGADAKSDYEALTKWNAGRRVNRVEPEKSLFLLKTTASISHGGGQKIQADSPEYKMLAAWVAQGAPWADESQPELVSIKAAPQEQVIERGKTQQLQVTGLFSDSTEKDVTGDAFYKSSEEKIAAVDGQGLVKAAGPGQATIVVS